MGYTTSPNIFAAVVVMLALVAIGCVVQRVMEAREPLAGTRLGKPQPPELGWAAVPGVAAALSLYLIGFTGAKGAYVALPIGVALLAAWWPIRNWLKAHFTFAFAVVALLIAIGGLSIIGYGLYFGSLPSDSMNFRWRYWVGSFNVLLEHPLLGVGWANFGNPYQAHRLVAAVEGIKDPHNWIVRLFVELGSVGGLLGIAWAIALAWGVTRPTPADAPAHVAKPSIQVIHLLWLPVGSLALYLFLIAGPLAGQGQFESLEFLKRILFTFLMTLAMGAVPILHSKNAVTDDRPAPLIHAAMVVGVAMFMMMSLIDMGLFAPGPLALMSMLIGAALGVRLHARPIGARGQAAVMIALVFLVLVWAVGLIVTVVPVATADGYADRAGRAAAGGKFYEASERMRSARDALPVKNAEYELLAAQYALQTQTPSGLDEALKALDRAVQADPTSPKVWLQRGRVKQFSLDAAVRASGLADFGKGVELSPSELSLRQEYADLLEKSGRPVEAVAQIEQALKINDGLDEKEPARLAPEQLNVLRDRAARLRARG
ncbi:MAG: O-antigen ligase family protein [Tepidisphaeraceae bacterium]